MTKIVSSSSGRLVLSSLLAESQFARTNLASCRDEPGCVVHLAERGATFSEYVFDSTFIEGGVVHFAGADCGGTLLCDALDDGEIVSLALDALSAAIERRPGLSAVGAGGIIVKKASPGAGGAEVLFLPGSLFERSAANLGEADYCENQGFYLRKGLKPRDALIFLRSVIAYRSVTGAFPFAQTELAGRQVDIFDRAFVPAELCVQGIGKTLASSIDAGLMIFGEEECFEGNRRFVNKKKKAALAEISARAAQFSVADFRAEKARLAANVAAETDGFAKARRDYVRKRDRKILFSRFFRRNRAFIRAGAAVAAVLSYALFSFHRTNQNLATSVGLTSAETVRAFYSFISAADVPNLQEIVRGKGTKDVVVQVAGFHVRAKERIGFSEDGRIVPVAERLFYKPESRAWMFGITNLRIDGVAESVHAPVPTRRDKPAPIAREGALALKKGVETVRTADYVLVTSDDALITARSVSERVTLRWDGRRWLVTAVEGTSSESRTRTKAFWNDWREAALAADGSVLRAAESLRGTYRWLPADDDIQFYSDKF